MPGIAPGPTPATRARMDAASVARAAKAGGFPDSVIPIMVGIAFAESRWDPTAVNRRNADGSSDYGLWQINSSHKGEFDMANWADPVANATMAYKVYKMQGLKAWSTYNSGAYKAYVPTASQWDVIKAGLGLGVGTGLGAATGDITPGTMGIDGIAQGIGTLSSGVSSFGKIVDRFGSNIAAITVAVVLLVLGVVILLRQTAVGVATGGALKAVKRVTK